MHDYFCADNFRDAVYEALVERVAGVVAVRSDYRTDLDPYSVCQTYPLNKVGIFPRVTRRYLGNWVNVPKLTKGLCSMEHIGEIARSLGLSRLDANMLVKDVLSRIGTESYTAEWTTIAAGMQIDDIIESSTEGITRAANEMLAQTLENKIISHFRGGPRRRLKMLDVGSGFGNTILPVMKKMEELAAGGVIPRDYQKYIQIFLLDVSTHSLGFTLSRLTSGVPGLRDLSNMTPIGNIVVVPANFAHLENNEILNAQKGNFDMIFSGAAICHQTDLDPFFRYMHSLLQPSGIMNVWDWYNGPSWAAPRLRLSKDDKRRTVLYMEGYDGVVYKEAIDDGDVLSPAKRDALYDTLENAKRVSSVYEMSSQDVGVVLANFTTLLGVLDYVHKDKESGIRYARRVGLRGQEIDTQLEQDFNRMIDREDVFSYFDDFLSEVVPTLNDRSPFTAESAYYLIEGYGDDYAGVMKRAGFRFAMDEFFMEVYHRHRNVVGRPLTGLLPGLQIRYTFGMK
ncbi:class I SAM-dependent methyltransferase [Candidatus Woesearchaeota archaeon]|nr:class I SAM-dependent methyltransferase [Candidatus Woesearchaeota archaeon]